MEIFSKNPIENLSLSTHQNDDDAINRNDDEVIKTFWKFVKMSTHSISLPRFIVIWLEIAKLWGGGGILPPPVFLGQQKPSPNRVKTEIRT